MIITDPSPRATRNHAALMRRIVAIITDPSPRATRNQSPLPPLLYLSDDSPQAPILQQAAPDGRIKVDVLLRDETVWLTTGQMTELFQVDKSGISRHLANIFETGELPSKATVAKIATVQREVPRNVRREIEYYNLDAIISVGYRVNSIRGTQFRIWATQRMGLRPIPRLFFPLFPIESPNFSANPPEDGSVLWLKNKKLQDSSTFFVDLPAAK